jgi:hypothetical protein
MWCDVRPAMTGPSSFRKAARHDYANFHRTSVRKFYHFSRRCRKPFSFEDIHGREAEAQDVHQRVAW